MINLRENFTSKPATKGNTFTGPSFKFHNVGAATIRRTLNKLQSKTSFGSDGIPINIYKEGLQALALPLTHLTNLVITTRTWPSQWKESVILPTLKSGKPPGILSSYRPVVNLCSVSKIIERVLYDQMVQHLDDNGVIPHEQHGFRRGRSTDTALATLFSRIAQAQDQSLKIGLTAFDYSAAFDLVSWEVLESKLGWACCHAKSLLKSYMSNRTQKVQWNSSVSKVLPTNFGMPQGSILAPLLFIIEKPSPASAAATITK